MDDFILLGLIAILFLLLGPIGFFMTLGTRSRLRNVEAQLAALHRARLLEEARETRSVCLRGRRQPRNARRRPRRRRGRSPKAPTKRWSKSDWR